MQLQTEAKTLAAIGSNAIKLDKTVNLEVFKLKKEKLFVLISITWYTDTLIPEVSYF